VEVMRGGAECKDIVRSPHPKGCGIYTLGTVVRAGFE